MPRQDATQPDIVLFHKGGREERRLLALRGEAPRDFFYGFLAVERDGHAIRWESTAEDYPGRIGYLRRFGERVHSRLTGVAWRPYALDRMGMTLTGAKLAVSFTDHFSLSLGRWGYGRSTRPFLVGLFHGLSDIETRVPRRARSYLQWYVRRAAAGLDRIGFLSAADRNHAVASYALDPKKTFIFDFGVDTAFWHPTTTLPRSDASVLAVGSDINRDYDLLLSVRLDRPLRIITRLPVKVPQDRTDVEVLSESFDKIAIGDMRLRDSYRAALCVVVPLHDCWQPSGQSVTLQAMACGAPVVLSNNRGLWAPSVLRDGENCLLVKPRDANAMKSAIDRLANDLTLRQRLSTAGRKTVEQHFSLSIGEAAAREVVNFVSAPHRQKTSQQKKMGVVA